MVEIMREAVREEKRRWIRESTSIFIAVDDRGSRRYVRFKCDTPALAAAQGQWSREGTLGCVECVHGKTFQQFDDDYARTVAAEIVRMVAAFCTPLHDAEDTQLTNHFVLSTKGFVSDKALQKVGHVLQRGEMRNIVMICRDPCHMIRIACKEPLEATGRFEQQHERLFGAGADGLFKDRRRGNCDPPPAPPGGRPSAAAPPGHRPTNAWQKPRPDMARTWPERGKNMAKTAKHMAGTWQGHGEDVAKKRQDSGKKRRG
jgi:hypothetical protein